MPTPAPMEVMFTTVPRRRARIPGIAASVAWSGPQNMTSMACR